MTRGNVVRDVSFEVRAGEIFGMSGLIGAGRTELMRLIYGADAPTRAVVASRATAARCRPVTDRSPSDAVKHGIALITEDRKGEGLLLPQPIARQHFARQHRRGGAARRASMREREAALRADADRRDAHPQLGPAQPVSELSGGNQQKVVIGRWLARDCTVLLFDEPTRGIDVGAKFDIYALMGALAREGRALVVVSSDLRELMLICDRIGVMSAGRMTGMFERENWTQDALLAAAFAGYANREAMLHEPLRTRREGARRRNRLEHRMSGQPSRTDLQAEPPQGSEAVGTRLGFSNYLGLAGALLGDDRAVLGAEHALPHATTPSARSRTRFPISW